jgi:hypothetical protein
MKNAPAKHRRSSRASFLVRILRITQLVTKVPRSRIFAWLN